MTQRRKALSISPAILLTFSSTTIKKKKTPKGEANFKQPLPLSCVFSRTQQARAESSIIVVIHSSQALIQPLYNLFILYVADAEQSEEKREDENNASLQFSMNMKLRRGKLTRLDTQRPVKKAAAEATEKKGMNNSRKMSVGLNVVCECCYSSHIFQLKMNNTANSYRPRAQLSHVCVALLI